MQGLLPPKPNRASDREARVVVARRDTDGQRGADAGADGQPRLDLGYISATSRLISATTFPLPEGQVLRYETGQYYRVHHDQNSPRSSAWGPRMFTVFMYIGDHNSYTGGETHFQRLGVAIPAKGGGGALTAGNSP